MRKVWYIFLRQLPPRLVRVLLVWIMQDLISGNQTLQWKTCWLKWRFTVMGKSSINGGFSIAIDCQRAHIISYNLTYNHIAQVETTSKNDNASKLRFRRDSGCCHKTYGSLEVISGYSQSSQRKKGSQQQNEHRIVKLTYNHLSLHNQALSQSLETNFQSNAAHTGPPMAMRESRTGLSQRTDGGNQLLKPKLQSIDSTKIGPKRRWSF